MEIKMTQHVFHISEKNDIRLIHSYGCQPTTTPNSSLEVKDKSLSLELLTQNYQQHLNND